MSTDNTGGPAFPHHFKQESIGDCKGMSMRDYFAAKAMQAIEVCHQDMNDKRECKRIACHAYLMADAMLEARSK